MFVKQVVSCYFSKVRNVRLSNFWFYSFWVDIWPNFSVWFFVTVEWNCVFYILFDRGSDNSFTCFQSRLSLENYIVFISATISIAVIDVNLTPPQIILNALFCIISSSLLTELLTFINNSCPYVRTGWMYILYVNSNVSFDVPHIVPGNLFSRVIPRQVWFEVSSIVVWLKSGLKGMSHILKIWYLVFSVLTPIWFLIVHFKIHYVFYDFHIIAENNNY